MAVKYSQPKPHPNIRPYDDTSELTLDFLLCAAEDFQIITTNVRKTPC